MGGIKPIKKISVYLGEQLLPFFLPSPKQLFKNLAWFPGLVPGVSSGADTQGRKLTPKIAKELNAKDRKS
jgi:hypothetical protein